MRYERFAALALALVACGIAGGLSAADRMRAASDGIYTDAQAARGATRYQQQCARCHGADLLGTFDIPSLRGTLIARWSTVPLGALHDYIGRAMPMQAPGVLSPAVNADILAFLLKANGYKAGATELPGDTTTLSAIRLDAVGDAALTGASRTR